MRFNLKILLLLIAAPALLGGCSKYLPKLDEVLPDQRTAYRKSETLPDLEVPPDLTTDPIQDRMAIPEGGEVATYSSYQERVAERRKEQEVEQAGQAALQKLEDEYLLTVEGAPGLVWPKLRQFWQDRGYGLELDDAELGVMETAWREDSEELVRDKFKVFSEQGESPTTTLLYVSHVGEKLVPRGEKLVWVARERDNELEQQAVAALGERLGGARPAAQPDTRVAAAPAGRGAATERTAIAGGGERAEIVSAGGGKLYLAVHSRFHQAWAATGQALQQAGVIVEEADADRGIYQIRWIDEDGGGKKGVWSKLAFWKKDGAEQEHRLSLTGVGGDTEVVVLDAEGRWDTSDAAGKLLARLHEQLNGGV